LELLKEWDVGYWKIKPLDASLMEYGLRIGEIWRVINTVCSYIPFYVETGDIVQAINWINKLHEIATVFNHSYSMTYKYSTNCNLLMKHRKFIESLKECDEGIAFVDKTGDRVLSFAITTYKARIFILTDDMQRAKEILQLLEKKLSSLNLIPVFLVEYRISRFMFDIHVLEDTNITNNISWIKKYQKKAFQSGKLALIISQKCMVKRTEILKLMATYYWLQGKPIKALRWWKKSIVIGDKLGARLELSRTYFEVGKRLIEKPLTEKHVQLQPKARALAEKIIGLTPEECLKKAEAMFREMDLQWDLEQLEKVRREALA
jgi:hypothetical protein